MRRSLGILLAAWALFPSGASACGLSAPWYVTSDDGYTGIFIIEKVIDEARCEARLNVFSPLGESAAEVCRVLRSDKVVVYCDIISASHFFWTPDNFILEDQGEALEGRWIFGHIGKRRFSEAVASASNCRHRRCGNDRSAERTGPATVNGGQTAGGYTTEAPKYSEAMIFPHQAKRLKLKVECEQLE